MVTCKQPLGPGRWHLARAEGENWYLGKDGFCDDCSHDFNPTQEDIWCWVYDNATLDRIPRERASWIWLCETCARQRGILW